ncbi:lysine--tRNA ligase [Priestia taiwanensis]|uniref:Lysine--tRNA ligase n=1 Tax=Priestia taiwanensis TaxID=1347902 RepID=A0A917AR35_9BACI|nr:lysine--tRNA ligase [Priestia taiwanensis]MBM7363309.1 lysyl-tRNA synthetase class 2 [Priestia taiwanensis]GGE69366.1 lysine--tRNA ligase [Priestia taiwanensis]
MQSEQMIRRVEKLDALRGEGIEVYPERFETNYELYEAGKLEDGTSDVRVAGRIISVRNFRTFSFVTVSNIEGSLQLLIREGEVDDVQYRQFHEFLDIGDFIGVEGTMYTTKTGEKTLRMERYTFLGKALRPLPEKWHGLTNIELRYRQRYLDLIMTKETQQRLLVRSKMIRAIRTFFEERHFIEVETPVLQHTSSGALAKPFTTYHNSLHTDLNLRIAPETYLKRLIVGGFTKVFEFAKCFRNEGISPQHLQEFTMLEGYAAYWDYNDTMAFMREMFLEVLERTFSTTHIEVKGQIIDFAEEWEVVSFHELILRDTGIDITNYPNVEGLYEATKRRGIDLEHEDVESLGRGNFIDLLYKKVSRPNIVKPTFLVEHPIDLSPLARANDTDETLTDRFQLIINGAEIINAYSELVNPIEQRRRLEDQALLKTNGDAEAMEMDEDYLLAMEYGMPPISGWGFSVERLLMVLTGSETIKDCVFFPLTKKV